MNAGAPATALHGAPLSRWLQQRQVRERRASRPGAVPPPTRYPDAAGAVPPMWPPRADRLRDASPQPGHPGTNAGGRTEPRTRGHADTRTRGHADTRTRERTTPARAAQHPRGNAREPRVQTTAASFVRGARCPARSTTPPVTDVDAARARAVADGHSRQITHHIPDAPPTAFQCTGSGGPYRSTAMSPALRECSSAL